MLEEIPYAARVAALVALMAIVAAVDYWRHRERATRWREHAFVLAAGLIVGLFGMVNDLLTSTISPDYFVIGKDIPADTLPWGAMTLGFQAGFSSGAIASAVCVWVATRRSGHPPMPLAKLALLLWRPFVLAVVLAVTFFLLLSSFNPLDFRAKIGTLLSDSQVDSFLRVWWIHLGLYVGLLGGVVWSIVAVVRWRPRGVSGQA